jgi:hypothetical protein
MSDPLRPRPFFLIVADEDRGVFSVEGPMTDDAPWRAAARQALDRQQRHIACGPTGSDRDVLAAEFQRSYGFGGVPPGSIVRPRA